MQGKINYQKLLDELLLEESIKGKRLLLHSCCAPCSSYVLTYLSKYFVITVFYYNPNISEQDEYRKRVEEQKRLIALLNEQPDTIYPKGTMNRSGFMRLSVAMRTMRKAASGASAVTGFAFWKRQSWQEKSSLIFLQQRFPFHR